MSPNNRIMVGLHVNGTARIVEAGQGNGVRPRVERWVEVRAQEAYIHCRKHLPHEVHPEVVDGFGKRLVNDLEWVNRGGQDRVWPNHASLDQKGDFDVGESSALADASALAVHGHAAADNQVHRWQLVGGDLMPALAAPSFVAASHGTC